MQAKWIVVTLLFAACSGASGEVFQCVQRDGSKMFRNSPCETEREQTVNIDGLTVEEAQKQKRENERWNKHVQSERYRLKDQFVSEFTSGTSFEALDEALRQSRKLTAQSDKCMFDNRGYCQRLGSNYFPRFRDGKCVCAVVGQ